MRIALSASTHCRSIYARPSARMGTAPGGSCITRLRDAPGAVLAAAVLLTVTAPQSSWIAIDLASFPIDGAERARPLECQAQNSRGCYKGAGIAKRGIA